MYDLVLKNGLIVDGTRSKPYQANVCVQDGKIVKITQEEQLEAKEILDVSGMAVSAGFIDIHSHSDACPLVDYAPESKLYQGVTTEIVGNCGVSILPSSPERQEEIEKYFFSELELPSGDLKLNGIYGMKDYAKAVEKKLKANGILCTVDERAEKIGFKIREARLDKLPYMLVVGQKEEEEQTVSVRSRFKGDEGSQKLDDFIAAITEEIRTKEIRKEEVQE